MSQKRTPQSQKWKLYLPPLWSLQCPIGNLRRHFHTGLTTLICVCGFFLSTPVVSAQGLTDLAVRLPHGLSTDGDGRFHLSRRDSVETDLISGNCQLDPLTSIDHSVLVVCGGTSIVLQAERRRAQAVWSGRTSWRGDLGERRRTTVAIHQITGLGDVLVIADQHEGTRICGRREPPMLNARMVEEGGVLRPITLPHSHQNVTELSGPAQPTTQPRQAPRVATLQAVSASSTAEDILLAGPPLSLLDGDPGTGWTENSPGNGEGQFVTFRTLGQPIVEIRIDALDTPNTSTPRQIFVVSESQTFEIPMSSGAITFEPEVPITGSCLSIIFGPSEGEHAALGEVTAYGILDRDGLGAVVAHLSGDASTRQNAKRVLTLVGDDAVEPLRNALPQMTNRERRSVADILISINTETSLRLLRDLLVDDLRREPSELDERTLTDQTLTELRRRRASDALLTLAQVPENSSRLSTEDHVLYGRLAARSAREASTFDAQGAAESALRLVFAQYWEPEIELLFQETRDALLSVLTTTFSEGNHTHSAQSMARLAYLLARLDDTSLQQQAAELLQESIEEQSSIEVQLLIGEAATKLRTTSPEITFGASLDTWLSEATASDVWTLRALAYEAMPVAQLEARLSTALSDPAAGVRAAIAGRRDLLGAEAQQARVFLLRNDSWALVRIAALEALAETEARADTLIAASMSDRHERVRQAALELAARRANSAPILDATRVRLQDLGDFPEVHRAGLRVVAASCDESFLPEIRALIEEGRAPGAWEPRVEVAVEALTVWISLADAQDAASYLESLRAAGTPALRAAAERIGPSSQRCE